MMDLPTKDVVARRIRIMMEAQNLGVSQAAKLCHIPEPTFKGYVRALNMPGGESVAKLARGLGCSADWLLAGGAS